METSTLFKQLKKGSQYFNEQFTQGNRNPVIMRQVADFERQVMIPLDLDCQKMSPEDRRDLEANYVPF